MDIVYFPKEDKFGIYLYLYLIHYISEIGMHLGMEYGSQMLYLKPCLYRILGEPDPYDIPLSHMEYPGGIIYEIMELPFHYRLEVVLHLPP